MIHNDGRHTLSQTFNRTRTQSGEPDSSLPVSETVGHAIVRTLEEHGIPRAYVVPGESFLEVLDGLRDSSIQTVVCRHEGGAAYMADAEGKLGELPGVAMVTRGPGFDRERWVGNKEVERLQTVSLDELRVGDGVAFSDVRNLGGCSSRSTHLDQRCKRRWTSEEERETKGVPDLRAGRTPGLKERRLWSLGPHDGLHGTAMG